MDSMEVAALVAQDKVRSAQTQDENICAAMAVGPVITRDGRRLRLVYVLAVTPKREFHPLWQMIPEDACLDL